MTRLPADKDRPVCRLELRLLGAFEMVVDRSPVSPLPSRKAQWLLALLALREGKETPREWLAETLWPDSEPQKALFNLRHTLLELRKRLGEAAGCLVSPTVRSLALEPDQVWIDVTQFASLTKQGTSEALEQAVHLYRGPLLDSCFEEWVASEREVYAQTYLAALEKLASLARTANDWSATVRWLRLTIQADPYRESGYAALMQALAERGDRAAVQQVYHDLRRRLRQELNSDPAPETVALYKALQRREAGPPFTPETAARPPTELPPFRLPVPLSDLIGRDEEAAEIESVLKRSRLVTLLGPGGIGKTRLAIAVAERQRSRFPQGVWFIDLAPLTEPQLIPQILLSTLGIKPDIETPAEEMLARSLAASSLLLVLDNCEHLVGACRQIAARLLSSCPHVRILATSRELLGVTGEWNYPVSPLSVPPPYLAGPEARGDIQEKDPYTLVEFGAVRLFVERATQAQPAFRLTPKNVGTVVEICRHLDGLPLAIEMAAARIRSLSVSEIRTRLEDRFRLLTTGSKTALPRHQTLHTMLDWSHDLLDERERVLFRRLSVFAGGWTLEAAEIVTSGQWTVISERQEKAAASGHWTVDGEKTEGSSQTTDNRPLTADHSSLDVLDVLASLVDKSMVVYTGTDGDVGRYRLLETVRQYARERLEEQGEWKTFSQRHCDYLCAFVETGTAKIDREEQATVPDARGEQATVLDVLDRELDNIRAALDFCHEEGIAETGLNIAIHLQPFMEKRGYHEELRRMVTRALSHPAAATPTLKRASGLRVAGAVEVTLGNYPQARSFYEEFYAVAESLGEKRLMGNAAWGLGNLYLVQGDPTASQRAYEQAIAVFKEIDFKLGVANLINNLGLIAMHKADYDAAEALMQEALTLMTEMQDVSGTHFAVNNLGFIAHLRGDYPGAKAYYERSIDLIRDTGDRDGYSQSLGSYADTLLCLGEIKEARRSYHESLLLQKEIRAAPYVALLLESCAKLALAEEDPARAARLLGAADALRQSRGIPLPLDEKEDYARTTTGVREALDEARFDPEWNAGCRLEMADALRYALEGTVSGP